MIGSGPERDLFLHSAVPINRSVAVFDQVKANTLAEHQPYDLKIEMEPGTEPPLSRIIPLSPHKLEALCKFLNKNLANGTSGNPLNIPS